jgi:hypothetical protein
MLSRLRADQSQRWRCGERVFVESYLHELPELASDPDALLQLVFAEMMLRRDDGETPTLDEYLGRFPQHADPLRRLWAAQDLLHAVPSASGAEVPPAPPTPAPTFRDFEVLCELGRGGMGVVYKARQRGLKRLVALKVLHERLLHPEGVARFRTEAEAVGRLRCTSVVAVYAFGQEGGCPFLAMEYFAGGSLKDLLQAGPLPFDRAAEVVRQVALGVQAAHEAGIVHRDLKPGNVLLDGERACVADFGLARLTDAGDGPTQTGAVMGTPGYLAPEQADGHGREAGPAADVWGIGAVLYHCLTGRPPLLTRDAAQTLTLVREGAPAAPRSLRPDVPGELDLICRKCLQRAPRDRYATAGEVAEDLGRWQRREPVRGEVLWAGRRLLARCGGLLALVALVALMGVAALAVAPSEGPGDEETRLAADLDRGRTVLLDKRPRRARLAMGSKSTLLTTDAAGHFTVVASDVSLVELARDPRRDDYRLTAEVRHLRKHQHDCWIGVYVGYSHRDHPNPSKQFTAVTFNDRIDDRKEHDRLVAIVGKVPQPRPKGNRLLFQPTLTAGMEWDEGQTARATDGGPECFVAAGDEETEWRTLTVEVTRRGLTAYWGKEPKIYAGTLTAAAYQEGLSQSARDMPAHVKVREAPVAFAVRGGVGLYVKGGSASFRNVAIEPVAP